MECVGVQCPGRTVSIRANLVASPAWPPLVAAHIGTYGRTHIAEHGLHDEVDVAGGIFP
jgi:hypothetical protein